EGDARYDERLAVRRRHGHRSSDSGRGGLRGDRGDAECQREAPAKKQTICRTHNHLHGTPTPSPSPALSFASSSVRFTSIHQRGRYVTVNGTCAKRPSVP